MTTILDQFITVFRFEKVGDGAIQKSVDDITRSIDRAASRMMMTAGMWAGGFIVAAKSVGSLEDKIIATARQARISTDDMWEHFDVLLAIGKQSGVTGDLMLESFDKVIEKTGKVKFALSNAQLIADLLRGGKMTPLETGEFISSFYTIFNELDPEKIRESADMIAYMAKAGTLEMKNMGDILPRMFSSVKLTGITDLREATKEVGILSQLINAITVTSSRTGTAFENMNLDFSLHMKEINALTGKNFSGNEGPIAIISAIADAYSEGKTGAKDLAQSILGEDMAPIEKMKNNLGEISRLGFGRRGIRGVAGVFFGGPLKEELTSAELASKSLNTLANDRIAYNKTIKTSVTELINLLITMEKKLILSGALQKSLSLLGVVLSVVSEIFKVLPNWLLSGVLMFLMWDKVIKGALVGSIYKLVAGIWGLFFSFVANNAAIVANINATKFAIANWIRMKLVAMGLVPVLAAINTVMMANPIVFIITAAILAVIALGAALYGLYKLWKKFFGKKETISPELDTTGFEGMAGGKLATSMIANLMPSGAPSVASSVSGSSFAHGAGSGGNVTNVNMDLRGASDPNAIRLAVSKGLKEYSITQAGMMYNETSTQEAV
jgi:hypothetical protein